MLIHIIKANGARFEATWPDGTPDARILADLMQARSLFGRTKQTAKLNDKTGVNEQRDDPAAPYAFDDPATIIAVGRAHGDEFVEVRRLRGPAVPPPEPASIPEPVITPPE